MGNKDVLVIGAGISGMAASMLLAKAGVLVHLVEKESYIGGAAIKFEDVFTNLECATCMLAPLEQDLLEEPNIHLRTLSRMIDLQGEKGRFKVKVHSDARFVSLENCIGCGACYDACPVSVPNEFEEGLSQRKAIYLPCAGALPNVPRIDPQQCLRFKGEECTACQEACVFEAIEYGQKDEEIELEVGAVIIATGLRPMEIGRLQDFAHGTHPGIYTAMEFERLFASNGPTEGEILLRDGTVPKKVALVHCVGRKEGEVCSAVCCRYLLKFRHYLGSKVPGVELLELHSDLCLPRPGDESFMKRMIGDGRGALRSLASRVEVKDGRIKVVHGAKGTEEEVDMVILSPALLPGPDQKEMAEAWGLKTDEQGYLVEDEAMEIAGRPGVYVIGCARGPKDIQGSVDEALAAVGRVLSDAREGP